MDLRHARLVHADYVPHFFHGQLFVIVESNHQTFSLRKTFDTPRQECDQLSSFEKIGGDAAPSVAASRDRGGCRGWSL